jgi:hypothetical protein
MQRRQICLASTDTVEIGGSISAPKSFPRTCGIFCTARYVVNRNQLVTNEIAPRNKGGRPVGSKNKHTLLMQKLLENNGEALAAVVGKTIKLAQAGEFAQPSSSSTGSRLSGKARPWPSPCRTSRHKLI